MKKILKELYQLFQINLTLEEAIHKFLLGTKSNAIYHDVINAELHNFCCRLILPLSYILLVTALNKNFFQWKIVKIVALPKIESVLFFNNLWHINIMAAISIFLVIRRGFNCTTSLLNFIDSLLRRMDSAKALFVSSNCSLHRFLISRK